MDAIAEEHQRAATLPRRYRHSRSRLPEPSVVVVIATTYASLAVDRRVDENSQVADLDRPAENECRRERASSSVLLGSPRRPCWRPAIPPVSSSRDDHADPAFDTGICWNRRSHDDAAVLP